MSPALAFALSVASGGLYGAALPPSPAPALAWVALVPWLVALAGAGPARAALLGLAFAAAATASVAAWFPAMLATFFGASPVEAWLGFAGLAIVVNGLACAAFAVWVGFVTRRGVAAPVLVAAAFVVAEWLRANGVVANPYALLGTALVDSPLAQTADLLGAPTLSFLLVLGNATVAGVLVRAYRPRRMEAVATVVLLLLATGYGLARSGHSFGEAEPVPVAVVQPAIPRTERDDLDRQLANVAHQLALSEAPAREGRMLFWPEAAVHSYLREPSPERSRLLDAAAVPGFELVLGGPHWRLVHAEPRTFSSVFLVRDGALARRYDKQRLVPFAEASPLPVGVAPAPARPYAAGSGPRLLETSRFALGAFLCGEVLFPEVARGLVAAGAEVLANPSNDDWFGHPAPAAHQLAVARLRAIENRRWLVRATTNGTSAILDAHGRVVVRSRTRGPEVLRGTVRRSDARTLAAMVGGGPVALAWLATLWIPGRALARAGWTRTGGRRTCGRRPDDGRPWPHWRPQLRS